MTSAWREFRELMAISAIGFALWIAGDLWSDDELKAMLTFARFSRARSQRNGEDEN